MKAVPWILLGIAVVLSAWRGASSQATPQYGYVLVPDFKCPEANYNNEVSFVYGFKNGIPVCHYLDIRTGGSGLTSWRFEDKDGRTSLYINYYPPTPASQ